MCLESSHTQVSVSAPSHSHNTAQTHKGIHATVTVKPPAIFLLSHDMFSSSSSGWANENDMRMVDVKPDEYALTHTIKTKGGDNTIVNKLYGKVLICPDATLSPVYVNVRSSSASMHTVGD